MSPALELVIGVGIGWFGRDWFWLLVVSLGLAVVFLLLTTVSFLDSFSSLFLRGNLVLVELDPEFVELSAILLTVVRMVNHKNVFLIVGTSLECPVKATCQHKLVVNDHKLIVHMVLRSTVGSHIDTIIS